MKQRLTLARAFLHGPRLLLLDEPYTGLDETACQGLDKMLDDFALEGGSFLMTTHDVDRGFRAASHLMILDRGRLVHSSPRKGAAGEFRDYYQRVLAG